MKINGVLLDISWFLQDLHKAEVSKVALQLQMLEFHQFVLTALLFIAL